MDKLKEFWNSLGKRGKVIIAFIVLFLLLSLVECVRAEEIYVRYDLRFNDFSYGICQDEVCLSYDQANDVACLTKEDISSTLRLAGGICYQHNSESILGKAELAISDIESTAEIGVSGFLYENYVEESYWVGGRYIDAETVPVAPVDGPEDENHHHDDHHHHRERH